MSQQPQTNRVPPLHRAACRRQTIALSIVATLMAAVFALPHEAFAQSRGTRPATRTINPDWLADLAPNDRQPLEAILGYAPPPFPDGIEWVNVSFMQRPAWSQFHSHIHVLQSWSHRDADSVARLQEVIEAMQPLAPMNVRVIALHTPDGADGINAYLDANPIDDAWIIVDTTGEFCDRLGVYRTPVNIVIDLHGAIRFAGLTVQGLTPAVLSILDEPCAPGQTEPEPVPAGLALSAASSFPKQRVSTRNVPDRRGRPMPEFEVGAWIANESSAPSADDGKMTLVEFWATWCGYCIKAIPHLNDLAEQFRDDLTILALTDETESRVQTGLQRRRLTPNGFDYPVGIDAGGRLKSTLGVRGIPYAFLLSRDGVVRWQGHPASLNATQLQRYIDANRSLGEQIERRAWQGE